MDPRRTSLIPGEAEDVGPATLDLGFQRDSVAFWILTGGQGLLSTVYGALRFMGAPVKCTGSRLICVVGQEDCGGPGKAVSGEREDVVHSGLEAGLRQVKKKASISFTGLVFRLESPEIHRIFLVCKYPEFF